MSSAISSFLEKNRSLPEIMIDVTKPGTKVRVVNSANDFYGDRGIVIGGDAIRQIYVVFVSFPQFQSAPEGPLYQVEFSENELEGYD